MPSTTRITERWREHLGSASEALRNWPWYDTLRTLRIRFREDHLGLSASSLTFTTIISLVPLMTVMLALFTAFPMFSRFQQALEQYLLRSLVPESIARPVLAALTAFAGKASQLGGFGLLILLVTALALVYTIDGTLNAIWRVPKPRPWAQRMLVYWAAMTLGPLVLGISLSLTSYAISASRGMVGAMPGSVSLVLGFLQFVLLAAGMAALYRFVPNTHVRWVHAWSGGLFVACGFEVAKRALTWYVASVPTYNAVYGAFATLPIFLLWIYLGWVVVLLGAVIAAYAPSLALHVARMPDRPGHRFALAVAVLRALASARERVERGLTLDGLARALRIDPLQVQPVMQVLHDLDWCARLDEDDADPRYVLLIEPAKTDALALINRLLLDDQTATRAFRERAELSQMTVAELIA